MNKQKLKECGLEVLRTINEFFEVHHMADRLTVLKCVLGSEITSIAGDNTDKGLEILDLLNRQLQEGIRQVCSGNKQYESNYFGGIKVKWEGE